MDEQVKSFQLTPAPDKNHHKRIILYTIGVLLLLIIGGGIGYLCALNSSLSPHSSYEQNNGRIIPPQNLMASPPNPPITTTPHSSMDTSGWKTFSNPKYDFEFSYPANLDLKEYPNRVNLYNNNSINGSNYINIGIVEKKIPTTQSLKDLIQQDTYMDLPSGHKGSIIQEPLTPYPFGQYEAYTFSGGTKENDKYIYVRNGTTVVIFSATGFQTGSSYSKNELTILNRLISTFKFTNQNHTSCNSNSDCQNNETCQIWGPLIANQPPNKVCTKQGEAVPL